MIPEFNEDGYLPAGVHMATLEEVVARFGSGSEQREACAQSLQWLLPMCRRARIVRVILNGSFISDVLEPGDVDCVLVAGDDYKDSSDAAIAIEFGLPYLSMQVITSRNDLDYFVNQVFSTDRAGRQKGLVEVFL